MPHSRTESLDYNFKYQEYKTLKALLNAVESGEVDFSINPITVTDSRMERLDFSQPYFISQNQAVEYLATGLKNTGSIRPDTAVPGHVHSSGTLYSLRHNPTNYQI